MFEFTLLFIIAVCIGCAIEERKEKECGYLLRMGNRGRVRKTA